jgi:hypothetical protein
MRMPLTLLFLLSIFSCAPPPIIAQDNFVVEFNEFGIEVSAGNSIVTDTCFSRSLQYFYFSGSKDSCISIDVVCQLYKIIKSKDISCNIYEKQEYIESNVDLLLYNPIIYESKNESLTEFLSNNETDILYVFLDEFNNLESVLKKIEYTTMNQVQLVEISLMFIKSNLDLPNELIQALSAENVKILGTIKSSELVEFDYSTSANFLSDYEFIF